MIKKSPVTIYKYRKSQEGNENIMNSKMSLLKIIGIYFFSILILVLCQVIASFWYYLDLYGMENIFFMFTNIGLVYLLLKLFVEKILKEKLECFRIGKFNISLKWIIVSIILPIFVVACIYIFIPGKFYYNGYSATKNISIILQGIFTIGISAGVTEEIIFRGIIMKILEDRYNIKIAIIIPSLLFGLLHIFNGQIDFFSMVLLILGGTTVGIMFSLLTYYSNSIWFSALVHSVWNMIIIGGICNFGIVKDSYAISYYLLEDVNLILTGGEFGIEVSIFAMVGYLLMIMYAVIFMKKENNLNEIKY